jgi:hypothetical protein
MGAINRSERVRVRPWATVGAYACDRGKVRARTEAELWSDVGGRICEQSCNAR